MRHSIRERGARRIERSTTGRVRGGERDGVYIDSGAGVGEHRFEDIRSGGC